VYDVYCVADTIGLSAELAGWQAQQHALNLRLLEGIELQKG
jgi:hypothetical protein